MLTRNIIPFKEREIDYSRPVDVYRCLNRKGRVFSIKQGSLVVAHTTELNMNNVKFVVNSAGKKKAIASKQRNVHAFIRGKIGKLAQEGVPYLSPLVYNPSSELGFCVDSKEVDSSPMISIREHGIYAMQPESK